MYIICYQTAMLVVAVRLLKPATASPNSMWPNISLSASGLTKLGKPWVDIGGKRYLLKHSPIQVELFQHHTNSFDSDLYWSFSPFWTSLFWMPRTFVKTQPISWKLYQVLKGEKCIILYHLTKTWILWIFILCGYRIRWFSTISINVVCSKKYLLPTLFSLFVLFLEIQKGLNFTFPTEAKKSLERQL